MSSTRKALFICHEENIINNKSNWYGISFKFKSLLNSRNQDSLLKYLLFKPMSILYFIPKLTLDLPKFLFSLSFQKETYKNHLLYPSYVITLSTLSKK